MYNIFKDIQQSKERSFRIATIAVLSAAVVCLAAIVICVYVIRSQYDNIYVSDSEGVLRAYKMKDIKENRMVEISAFVNDFINLSFSFVSDRNNNERSLNMASLFVADNSFKLYVDKLNNSSFWNELSTYDLRQYVKEEKNRPLVKIVVKGGVNPFQIETDFFVEIIRATTREVSNVKHLKATFSLYNVPRTYNNPHGFRIKNFNVNVVQQ